MLKFFSLSLGLAIALGTCGLSVAGGHGKSLPSGQCETPSAQSAVPSAQSIGEGCGDVCGPVKKKCNFLSMFKPKPCTYTYEWVLKKKKVHTPWFGHKNNGCGNTACDSCGTTPSGQSYGSGQSLGSGQSWGAGQSYGAGQNLGTTQIPAAYSAPQGAIMPAAGAEAPPAPAGAGEAAPVAPVVPVPATPPTASNGGPNFLPAGN
jgi:hypothetical protein